MSAPVKDIFPSSWPEILACFCCYALTAGLFVIVTRPYDVFACAMRVCEFAARVIGVAA